MTQLTQDERIGNSLAIAPITEGRTELAIKDDDGNEHYHDLDELRSRDGILDLNQASMNIDNSNDVIVGPVTQFYAPVTIIQSPNGQVNPTVQNGGGNNVTVEGPTVDSKFSSTEKKSKKTTKNYIIIGIILTSLVLTGTVAAIFIIRNQNAVGPDPNFADPPNDIDNKWLLTKEDWGGKKPKYPLRPLKHPVQYVIISHTVSPMCDTFHDCSRRIQNIQTQHMNGNSPDIGYNFIVGGDGHAYVGRGWNYRNFHMDNTIGICFIGDFTSDEPTKDMLATGLRLLDEGEDQKFLSSNYEVVGHNQTMATDSPGSNLYKEIRKWKHFNPLKSLK